VVDQKFFYHRDSELTEQVTTNNAFKNSGLQTVKMEGKQISRESEGKFLSRKRKTSSEVFQKKPDVLN